MKTLHIYTCQMAASKKINDSSFLILDVTVKSGDKIFAPTWSMVTNYKKGTLTWREYSDLYKTIMRDSYKTCKDHWEDTIIRATEGKGLVLVCYCAKGEHCHRHLLKEYVSAVAKKMGYTVVVHEE